MQPVYEKLQREIAAAIVWSVEQLLNKLKKEFRDSYLCSDVLTLQLGSVPIENQTGSWEEGD